MYCKTDEFFIRLMKELKLENFDTSYDVNKVFGQKLNEANVPMFGSVPFKHSSNSRFMQTNNFCQNKDGQITLAIIGGKELGKSDTYVSGIELITNEGTFLKDNEKGTDIPFLNKRRWGHSSVNISDTNVYLFGGFDHQSMYNDLHCFNSVKNTIKPIKTSGDRFTHRAGHSTAKYKSNVILFGGKVFKKLVEYNYLNDLYFLNLETLE